MWPRSGTSQGQQPGARALALSAEPQPVCFLIKALSWFLGPGWSFVPFAFRGRQSSEG